MTDSSLTAPTSHLGELVDDEWAGNFNGVVNKPAGIPVLKQELSRVLPWWMAPDTDAKKLGKKQKTSPKVVGTEA